MDNCSWTNTYRRGDHVLRVYSSDQERLQTIVDIMDWMEDGDVLVHLSTLSEKELLKLCSDTLAERMREMISAGRMILMDSYSFYCVGDNFNPEDKMERWNTLQARLMSEGYTGVVVIGDLSWSAGDGGLLSKVIQYESSITMKGLPPGMTAVCQYDSRLYEPEEIEYINSVHELQVDGCSLKRNYWLISKG